jgi:hypothetical protein
MSTKRWILLGLALVLMLSLLPGCSTQLKVPASVPQANEPLPSPGRGEGYVGSLFELIDYWEDEVHLEDLVGPEKHAVVEEALALEGAMELYDILADEGYELNPAEAEVTLAEIPASVVTIVYIPSLPGPEDTKAALIVALPGIGIPIYMAYTTSIDVIGRYGSVVVHPSFFIRAYYWVDGRIFWWHYWWYDSHNHPNWYYSWWYWHWWYYWDHDYPWYPWYTWYYSWFYWDYWWYWSTWWAF